MLPLVSLLFSKSLLEKVWFDLASYDFPLERYGQKEEMLMSLSTVNPYSAVAQDITAKLKNSEFVLLACQKIILGWKIKCVQKVEPVVGRTF